MKIYKVLPKLEKKRHLKIWHKALRSQWSALDLNWDRPLGIRKPHLKDQLARVLSPVLMGEQAALYSVSNLIPILGKTAEVESQFYLTTWAVDEARHTELFTLFYERLDREPLPIRKFPQGYLFQSYIVSEDPAEWLAGVLVSEVTAKKLMEEFRRLDLDPVLSDISDGILIDEARHLGFNHIYVEDRFSGLYSTDDDEARRYREHLESRMDTVMAGLVPTLEGMDTELRDLGIDRAEVFDSVQREARWRLEKSIEAGRRVAAGQALASDARDAELIGA